ncbi:hypothetical protein LRP30_41925 [Bradyrhizobium sp. C-145]|uniref:hypothetical protein n=1 Tax=Bradyrhizobium sp. C-145 TaxID=574727 RepID=UPI00201B5199|nr:hypothetical protein [Bradyrhizobium sp. C-145]UQR63201.1 hypothetical protein LRP30_41925 [Bradyrhizobium sp. C-145]
MAVTKRSAEREYVDPNAAVPHADFRPDPIEQLPLGDYLAWPLGKTDQNIQCSTADVNHLTVAPEHPLANREFERAEP